MSEPALELAPEEASPEKQLVPMEAPPLELVIHTAVMSGGKIPMPDGNAMQIINYSTPALSVTTKMDMNGVVALCKILFENITDEGKKALIELLTGVEVVRPSSVILPS